MFVDTRELDVGFVGVCDDEAVDKAFADGVRDEVAEEVLDLDGRGVG